MQIKPTNHGKYIGRVAVVFSLGCFWVEDQRDAQAEKGTESMCHNRSANIVRLTFIKVNLFKWEMCPYDNQNHQIMCANIFVETL